MKKKLLIKGIDCANCAVKLEEKIKKIEGTKNVSMNFLTEKLVYECDDSDAVDIYEKVLKTIKKEEPDVEVEEI